MNFKSNKAKIRKIYQLLFLLVALATIPFFKSSFGFYISYVALLINMPSFTLKKEFIYFMVIVIGLEAYHINVSGDYDINVTKTVVFYFLISALILYYIKLNLLPAYIKLLYYATIISFPFFILYYVDKGLVHNIMGIFPDFFVTTKMIYGYGLKQVNPIFYNFDYNYLKGRNNGPFWEPTVFAIMLIIAQIFNLLLNKRLFNKQGIVFSIGILTTLSTTGYLAYFILLLGYIFTSKHIKIVYKAISVTLILIVGINLFTNFSFLNDKIKAEFDDMDDQIKNYGGDSRIASAFLDITEVCQKDIYLILGKGSSRNVRIGTDDKESLRNCGDTALIVEWGIPFTLLYFGLMYYSFNQLTKYYKIHWIFPSIFLVIFLILGFSEVIFDLPFFHCFLFIGFIVKRYYGLPSINDNLIHGSNFRNQILNVNTAGIT